jgi:hypothetical protein
VLEWRQRAAAAAAAAEAAERRAADADARLKSAGERMELAESIAETMQLQVWHLPIRSDSSQSTLFRCARTVLKSRV